MSTHLEWVHAGHHQAEFMDAEEVGDASDDGNENLDVGLYIGESDGAALYGTLEEIKEYLTAALALVNTNYPPPSGAVMERA